MKWNCNATTYKHVLYNDVLQSFWQQVGEDTYGHDSHVSINLWLNNVGGSVFGFVGKFQFKFEANEGIVAME